MKLLNTATNAAAAQLAKSGALVNLGIEPVAPDVEQFKRYIADYLTQSAHLPKGAGFRPE